MSIYITGYEADPALMSGDDIIPFVEQAGQRDAWTTVTKFSALLDTLPVTTGTANGVLYLNGSKVVTSGTALTFDGTNLNVGTTAGYGRITAGNAGSTNYANVLALNGTDNAANGSGIIGLRNNTNAWLIGDTASALGSGTGFINYNYGAAPWIWYLQTGSEQMRLTSTGLGIGTSSPSRKLDVQGAPLGVGGNGTGVLANFVNNTTAFNASPTAAISLWNRINAGGSTFPSAVVQGGKENTTDGNYAGYLSLQTTDAGGTSNERMRLDSSGNLGLGVTPSAWVSNRRVLEIGGGAAALALNGSAAVSEIFANAIRDTGGAYRYFANGAASYVDFNNSSAGGWSWSIAPSWDGTGSNAISFTQAMTLTDANRLLIGATADKTQEVLRIASSGQTSLLLDNAGKTNGAFVGAFNDAALFGVNRNPSTGVFYNTSNYAAEIVALGSSSNSYIAFATANAANTPATERLRLKSTGQLRYVPLAADPAGAEAGDVYYNSSTNKLRVYNGTAWVDLH